jgi:hypothetical protein
MASILLRNILGVGFEGMPESVHMHTVEKTQDAVGNCHGQNWPYRSQIRELGLSGPLHR